ncbi:MAG: HigA family addiction module antitoxin [Thermoleophilia bacterium]|nr:HigA family addiction module antitoxin [Thermoleophilia bacterium]
MDRKLIAARVPPPGRTIRKELAARGWTQRYLAEQMGRPEQKISEIISGKKRVTEGTALELEEVFGIDASFWLSLEGNYRLHVAREARMRRKAG